MSEESKVVEKPSLLGMITSPSVQFERIRERPLIWGAMSIIIILFIIGAWLTSLSVDIEIDEALQGFFEVIFTIFIIIGGIIGPLFGTLITSVIHLLIAKMVQSSVSFRQLFSMNTYIMIISVLSMIVNGIILTVIHVDSEKLPTSLGSIIDAEGSLGAVLGSIEIFAIWGLILVAIGLHKVAGFSKGLAWTVSIAFFVISIIFALIGAGIQPLEGI